MPIKAPRFFSYKPFSGIRRRPTPYAVESDEDWTISNEPNKGFDMLAFIKGLYSQMNGDTQRRFDMMFDDLNENSMNAQEAWRRMTGSGNSDPASYDIDGGGWSGGTGGGSDD